MGGYSDEVKLAVIKYCLDENNSEKNNSKWKIIQNVVKI